MQFLCPYIYVYLLYVLFLACTYFVPLLLFPAVSVFHLFRDPQLSVSILVQCPFLEVLAETISPPSPLHREVASTKRLFLVALLRLIINCPA